MYSRARRNTMGWRKIRVQKNDNGELPRRFNFILYHIAASKLLLSGRDEQQSPVRRPYHYSERGI